MNKKRRLVIESNEISELRTYNLGGHLQKVLIDGRKKSNPMIIFLHGGPASPIPFCIGCRGMFPEITDVITMVYWDQLGCGKNDYVIDDTFSVQNFVVMTIDLIKCIKKDFPENKLWLYAMSWGSVLASRASETIPELIDGVVIYGQALKQLAFNDEIFGALENSSMPTRKKKRVAVVKERRYEYHLKDLNVIKKFVKRHTDGYVSKFSDLAPIDSAVYLIRGIISSPDYSLKDLMALPLNGFRKNTSVHKEIFQLDLSDTLKNLSVPYYIIQGEKDLITSTEMIKTFMKNVNNPNIRFGIVEDSSHVPSKKGWDVIKLVFKSIYEGNPHI